MGTTLGDNIRLRRTQLEMSQDDLADAVGVNRVTLSKYERNLIEPSASKLLLIAAKLCCTTSALMGDETAPTIRDEDIKFALFGGDNDITDAQYEEVKRYARYIKEREASDK